jgi:hypothetical protein
MGLDDLSDAVVVPHLAFRGDGLANRDRPHLRGLLAVKRFGKPFHHVPADVFL